MKNNKHFKHIYKKVSEKIGVSPDQFRNEIEKAIEAALENPDPMIQKTLSGISVKKNKPTPEELISYIFMEYSKRNGYNSTTLSQ